MAALSTEIRMNLYEPLTIGTLQEFIELALERNGVSGLTHAVDFDADCAYLSVSIE